MKISNKYKEKNDFKREIIEESRICPEMPPHCLIRILILLEARKACLSSKRLSLNRIIFTGVYKAVVY